MPNPRAEKSRLPPGSLEPFNRFKWGEEASLSSLPPPSLFPSACFKIRRGGFNDSPTLRWHWILSRSTSFSSPQNLPTPLSDLGRRRQRTIRFQNFFPLRFRHFVLSNVINGTTLLSCCCCCKIKRGGLMFEYYFILTIFVYIYIYIYIYIYKIVAHVVKESLTFYQICCCCCKIKRGELMFEY